MRPDPVFSGGVLKAALIVLVAVGLGAGAYALAGGGVGIDLPDLPDIDTTAETTVLEEGNYVDTTLGTGDRPDEFTSAGLDDALGKLREEVGETELTRLTVNEAQTQFFVRRGDGVEAYSYRNGKLIHENATIRVTGDATVADFAFPSESVQASAVDRMLKAAQKKSGAADFEPTVLSLERGIPIGERELSWTISAEGGGRFLTYRADADGSNVTDVGGTDTPIPPSVDEARELNECISNADDDTDAIFECLQKFQ
jgi:hypothetical protein